jgi:geranylgeranyl pyrophosphate synthase
MATSLTAFVEEARARVEAALERYLPLAPACPPLLAEALRYSVLAGGKRLRPLLVLAAADAVAPPERRPEAHAVALPAACAVELLHTYSLIHDDLPAMDNDTLRRGRPTLHVVHGDGIAILAGDALQAEAFALLAREPAAADPALATRKLRALSLMAGAAGATGMVGGQAIDLQAAGQAGARLTLDADSLRAMHARKTGALIRAAAMMGAVMGGAADPVVDAVGRWASEIGLAFQIVDDILDVEGSADDLGKTAGKDAAGDKPTYPSLFGLDASRAMAAACAARAQTILEDARLTHGHLGAIADWIVARRN